MGRLKGTDDGEYTLFDRATENRSELIRIKFQPVVGEGPRKLACLLPKEPVSEGTSQAISDANSTKVTNLKPKWSRVLNSFVLNFQGRVKVPSVKNFILSYPNSEENLLLFGKLDDQFYHLDFKAPFSPIQAMAVALSAFDYSGS